MSRYLGLEYTDWSAFDRAVETAKLNKEIADVMLIELRTALIPLGDSIGVLDADASRKFDEFRSVEASKRAKP